MQGGIGRGLGRGIAPMAGDDARASRARAATWMVWGRLALPLLALLMLTATACGPTTASVGVASNQAFVWPLQQEAKTSDEVFDPAEISTAYDTTSAQMIFSGLVTLGPDLTVQLDDAKSIDVDPTGKQYTFHLLPGLRFSDGQPIRAADFAYAIDRALDPHLCDTYDTNGKLTAAFGNSPYGPNCTPVGQTYLSHILGADARINGNGGSDHSVVAQGTDPTKGVNVVDDQTLILRLDQPVAFFLEALTYSSSYPLEQSLVQKYKGGQWVYHLDEGGCSGPFKVAAYSGGKGATDATTITYVPNLYWEQAHNQRLTLTRVTRPYVMDIDQEYNNYRAGQYDYTDVPGHDYVYARGQEDFHEVAGLENQYFGLNFQVPPFDSQAVRQAFDLALNKQDFVDKILEGAGIPTNHIVPQGMPGFYPALVNPAPDNTQAVTGNQNGALQLIAQAQQNCHGNTPAGYTPFKITDSAFGADPDYCPYIDAKDYHPLKEIDIWVATSNQTRVALTSAAVDEWANGLGLDVVEKTIASFSDLYANVQHGVYGAWAIGWIADYPDPQDWLSLQFASTAPYNYSHIADPQLDALLTKADLDQNPVTRMQEYNQAEQMVVNLVPWIPYEQQKLTWRQRSWVHGFGLNGIGSFPDTSWPQVYIIAH